MQKLIVVSGLPGAGKSTVADGLARELRWPVFSIDPIEAAMWRGGIPENTTGIAAYLIAAALAEEHLYLGQSAIIDAVSAVQDARDMWRNIAKKHDVPMVVIEVVCSDEALHKRRVDSRVRSIEGMPEVVWERVLERKKEFEPWKEPHLVLDSVEERDVLLRKALEYAR